ncbi:hypothetical protein EBZ39_03745 [bacterium]|nr:hypothetical protein [bacterium]
MKTNEKVEQGYEVDTLKPLSQCSVDELEYATEDTTGGLTVLPKTRFCDRSQRRWGEKREFIKR